MIGHTASKSIWMEQTKYDQKGSETSDDFRKGKTDSKVSDEIKISSYNNDESV